MTGDFPRTVLGFQTKGLPFHRTKLGPRTKEYRTILAPHIKGYRFAALSWGPALNNTAQFFFSHIYFPASGQAVVTGVDPSPPRFLPSIFIAYLYRVQQSHCSSIFHRVLLTHALALSASQFVHKKKSQRIYTSMHSAGLELTKLTYTRLEDNLIRHRGGYPLVTTCRTCGSHPNCVCKPLSGSLH